MQESRHTPDSAASWQQRIARAATRHPRLGMGLHRRWRTTLEQLVSASPLAWMQRMDALLAEFELLLALGRGESLEEQLRAALAETRDAHDSELASRLNDALAALALHRGALAGAHQHWQAALDLVTFQAGTGQDLAARLGLARVQLALGGAEKAQLTLKRLVEEADAPRLRAQAWAALADAHLTLQQPAQATVALEQAVLAATQSQDRPQILCLQWRLDSLRLPASPSEPVLELHQRWLAMARAWGHQALEHDVLLSLSSQALEQGQTDAALRTARQAQALAEALQDSRRQLIAHRCLSDMLRTAGQPAGALQELSACLQAQTRMLQKEAPALRELLGAGTERPTRLADERLLALSSRYWPVDTAEDLRLALLELRPALLSILQLDSLQVWWDEHGHSAFASIAHAGPLRAAELTALRCPHYLTLLDQADEPLALPDLALHPCHQELSQLRDGELQGARLELPLRLQRRQLRGVLWLQREATGGTWRPDELTRAHHVARLCERLMLSLDLARARNARHELEQERYASLGRMVAGVAHDVSTPIGVAITAASGISDSSDRLKRMLAGEKVSRQEMLALSVQLANAAELVDRNLQRAATLIGDFKRIAVDQSAETTQIVHLGAYLQSVVSVHSPALRRARVQTELEVDSELSLETVPGMLSQVLSNLIMNSLTHAFPQGQAGTLRLNAHREGERIVLRYADDGVGLSPEVRTHLFEPFFTTRRAQGGSGLGMYIVATLIRRLQGSCRLEDGTQGFALRIELPTRMCKADNEAPPPIHKT